MCGTFSIIPPQANISNEYCHKSTHEIQIVTKTRNRRRFPLHYFDSVIFYFLFLSFYAKLRI